MPQDIGKAKRNVAKMVAQNAPESDIDSYIASEGLTLDQIKNFKEAQQILPQSNPSINRNVGYFQHPFGSLLDTVLPNESTGKSALQGVANLLDAPMAIPNMIAQGVAQTNTNTGLAQKAAGITKAGVGVASIPFAPAISTANAIGNAIPPLGRAMGAISTPVQSLTGSQSPVAQTVDNLVQLGILRNAGGIKNTVSEGLQARGELANAGQIQKAKSEIKKVAPPTAKELNYDQALERSLPYIEEEHAVNPITAKSDLSPVRQATNLLADAKANLWNNKISPIIERFSSETIDGTPIANSIRSNISDYVKRTDPTKAQNLEAYAKSFEGEIPIGQANSFITDLNAKTSAYQKSSPVIQAQIEGSNPRINAEITAVEALRKSLYDKLDELGVPEVKDLKQDYGSLMQVHRAMERKVVGAEKDATSASFYGKPIGTGMATLAGIEGAVHAPVATGLAGVAGLIRRTILERNKPNPTILRAFDRLPGRGLATPPSFVPDQTQVSPTVPTWAHEIPKTIHPLNWHVL